MLDPIADKVLVAVALMMLVAEGTFRRVNPETGASVFSLLRLVPALIILAREILVSGLRVFLAGTRVSVPVTAVAKFKTAVQMIAIGAMILTPLADEFVPGIPSRGYSAVAYLLLWVAAALTVYTGVVYFRSGMRHLRPGVTPERRDQIGSRETA
jgi:cardiolipin synthase